MYLHYVSVMEIVKILWEDFTAYNNFVCIVDDDCLDMKAQ